MEHKKEMNPKPIWLGTMILKFEMPVQFVDDINEIYDKHIKKLPHHNNKLAGKIVNEHTIDYLLTDAMKAEFKSMFKTYLIHAQKPYWDCKLTSAWVNEMKINEYNPFNYHTSQNTELGLSSVLVLKTPDSYGSEITRPDMPANGHLEFIGGSQDLLGRNNLKVNAEEGEFYIFPYSLMHGVYPFSDTDEKRRTLSYNCDLIKHNQGKVK